MELLSSDIGWLDVLIIVMFFILVLGVAVWSSYTAKKNTTSGYFLAGRNMNWILIGVSTFATNVGAPMFIGLAGSAAATGIAVTMFEWHAMWMLLLLGWVLLPVYISSGCITMPQYLKLRYGGRRISVWISIIYLTTNIISLVSGQIFAGSVFVEQVFKVDTYVFITVILVVAGTFTLIGGLTTVMWTDAIQTVVLIGGAATSVAFALIKVNGFGNLRSQFMGAVANHTFVDSLHVNNTYMDDHQTGNETCGIPPPDSFHIFRSADSPDYPWPGMVFGLTILGINAWCTDQTFVQRSLSAKNMLHAKAGLALAAYLKTVSPLLFIVPGMIGRILYPEEVACADPIRCEKICQNKAGCYDIAYALLVLRILPNGVRGLMMAALLSALMTTLTSIFNSSSTVFTMDLWSVCRPKAKESEKMIVGRVWVLVMIILSALWVPVLRVVKGSQFWAYSQSIVSFLLAPSVMVFLFGIFWKRTTEQGAFWGLMTGLVVGVIRMGLQWSRTAPPCGSFEEDTTFAIVSKVNYLHFAIILSAVTSLVIVAVSIMTKPRSKSKLRRVTWWTKDVDELPEESDEETDDVDATKNGHHAWSSFDGIQLPEREQTDRTKNFCLIWFCGVDKTVSEAELTFDQKRRLALKVTSIKENPFWKKIMNANAVVCAAVCLFLHVYWA